jgi:hypothetical protein
MFSTIKAALFGNAKETPAPPPPSDWQAMAVTSGHLHKMCAYLRRLESPDKQSWFVLHYLDGIDYRPHKANESDAVEIAKFLGVNKSVVFACIGIMQIVSDFPIREDNAEYLGKVIGCRVLEVSE